MLPPEYMMFGFLILLCLLGRLVKFIRIVQHLQREHAIETDVDKPFEGGRQVQVQLSTSIHSIEQLKDVHNQSSNKHELKLELKTHIFALKLHWI